MSKYGHRPHNWFEAIVNKMGGEENAEKFLRGELVIPEREYVIDCSAPVILDGLFVISDSAQLPNRILGQFNLTKIRLHLDEGQKDGKHINGNKLREALKDQKVLTAYVLDFLLKKENQHLIPEEWKGKEIFFWGTIYCDAGDFLSVRYLYWGVSEWYWNYYRLDFDWDDSSPAACAQ